jgi:hypothetical protein
LWIAALCAEAEANAKQSVTAPTNPFGSFFPFLSPWQSEPQSFAKRKGLWVGGPIPLGCATVNKKLIIVPEEAETVRTMFRLYLECGSVGALAGTFPPEHRAEGPKLCGRPHQVGQQFDRRDTKALDVLHDCCESLSASPPCSPNARARAASN